MRMVLVRRGWVGSFVCGAGVIYECVVDIPSSKLCGLEGVLVTTFHNG